jgi:hypothetical protein
VSSAKLLQRTLRRRISWPQQQLLIDKYGVRIYRTAFGNTRYSTKDKPNGHDVR